MSIAMPRNASLIDTLSAGYRAVHRRPWVIAIPAALNAYLWLGAPVALAPLAADLQAGLHELGHLLVGPAGERERLVQGILATDMRVAAAWLNVVPVLVPPAPPLTPDNQVLALERPLQLLLVIGLINVVALLLSSYFLLLLNEAVSGESNGPLARMRRALEVAGTIVRYLLALLLVGLVLALPFLALSAIVIAILPDATLFVLLAWYVALFWAYVYTGFAPEAILVGRVGPLRAVYHSVHLVRRNVMATLGLLLVSFVIINGLGVIWHRLALTPVGLGCAILGSAYIGSGLSAARLEFYRARRS